MAETKDTKPQPLTSAEEATRRMAELANRKVLGEDSPTAEYLGNVDEVNWAYYTTPKPPSAAQAALLSRQGWEKVEDVVYTALPGGQVWRLPRELAEKIRRGKKAA